MKKIISLVMVVLMFVVLLSGCGLNTNPPEYMKDVVVYNEGSDGIVVYFVLADETGEMTTADGTVYLYIYQTVPNGTIDISSEYWRLCDYDEKIYETNGIDIKSTDFKKVTVGEGAFEHEVILFSFGRIPYSKFSEYPSEIRGKVNVSLHPKASSPIEGESTFSY